MNNTWCKMGVLFTLLFVILIYNIYGQKKPINSNTFRDIDKFILLYADSINKCPLNDSAVPSFLYENNFDLKPLYWQGMHKPISLRYLILQKVSSTKILDLIINKGGYRLKILPLTDSPVPFRKYSFYDLMIYRLNELRTMENYKNFKKDKK